MPWNKKDYPNSWKNEPKKIRDKAIEIGNALKKEGMEDDKAIPTALTKAREFYKNKKKKSTRYIYVD